jgi:phospholipase/lecithinase/hemolysin
MNRFHRPLSILSAAGRFAAAVATLVLASCGGGNQIDPFEPTRVIAFGDDLSTFTADGRKYAINGLTTDGQRDCTLMPLWVQVVASLYGYGFDQCPVGSGAQKAFSYAAAGARVQEVVDQIEAVQAGTGYSVDDLVLLMVGMNDVLELYAQYPARTKDDLTAEARARGIEIGNQVNRLVGWGARVIVSTIPDLGLTPFAASEKLAHPGEGRDTLLSDLAAALNGRIRVTIINDGRYVGLVLGDEYTQTAYAQPGAYNLSNVKDPACQATAVLPDCDTSSLVAGANNETWLWADARRPATNFHRQIGAQAESRARNNPF